MFKYIRNLNLFYLISKPEKNSIFRYTYFDPITIRLIGGKIICKIAVYASAI